MKKLLIVILALGFIFCMTQPVLATTIFYETADLGGGQWEYTYTVSNDTLSSDIEEFTIYFDLSLYDNLNITNTPADWDAIAINPDPMIPDDGFYDALALSTGIAPIDSLTGFSVSFTWLGQDAPGSQIFEIVDAWTWEVMDEGMTTKAAASVPEPATIFLIGSGLIGLAVLRKKRNI